MFRATRVQATKIIDIPHFVHLRSPCSSPPSASSTHCQPFPLTTHRRALVVDVASNVSHLRRSNSRSRDTPGTTMLYGCSFIHLISVRPHSHIQRCSAQLYIWGKVKNNCDKWTYPQPHMNLRYLTCGARAGKLLCLVMIVDIYLKEIITSVPVHDFL
ncbi:unnamed protein product [Lactuca virosa]|uniref:Uncharacterized protein n=1 Tax=Lactuca virosa TaxID=75947 RepID=A0AAU9N911_9ASTR|nr:unnamed protein product [Lactuca virosa]